MITFITGAPGAGKTSALVSMLKELGKDRPIYVNGIPGLTIDHTPLSDEDAQKWHLTIPDGACVVIDEVQRLWRPRGPGSKVPPEIQALETHRHRGLDFYVITQKPSLCDKNIRDLAGRHVHLRDIGILGRWWYEWPEISDQCATSWKQAPIKKRYRLNKKIFSSYKSASIHVKPVRSVPWIVVILLAALLGTGVLSWMVYNIITEKMFKPDIPAIGPAKTADNPLGLHSMAQDAPQEAMPAFIDDRVAFIPRVSNKPESAPAYDGLRQIVAMPTVVGGVCMGEKCKCYTAQATDAGLSPAECKTWLENPPFDPYRQETAPQVVNANGAIPSAPVPAPPPEKPNV